MQVFVLDRNPGKAAQYHCDVHCSKMILETAQILCSALHLNGRKDTPYKPTHPHHPCVRWAAASVENYVWLLDLGFALSEEFVLRRGKSHASSAVISWASNVACRAPRVAFTGFAQAMPLLYRSADPVRSYRDYYVAEKREFVTYAPPRDYPSWYVSRLKKYQR